MIFIHSSVAANEKMNKKGPNIPLIGRRRENDDGYPTFPIYGETNHVYKDSIFKLVNGWGERGNQ